jgi:hypothetical protein
LAYAETVRLFERPLPVLSLDALIMAKKAAGRPVDEADVIALEALRELKGRRPAD